jgi:hypothetical protein
MRLPVRLGFLASLAAIAMTAACSDSSGPSAADTASEIAARFDSIYVDAVARSDSGNNGFETRELVASLLEIPPALGATPATINVTTASGSEQWKAYEFVELTAPNTTLDSAFVLLAFREANAHTVLVVFFDSTGAPQTAGLITNDTLSAQPTNGSGATTLLSLGDACGTPPATLVNPEFDSSLSSSCALANFHTSVSLQFSTSPNIDAALASLAFPLTTINGIRIVDPPDESPGRRIRALLHLSRGATRL